MRVSLILVTESDHFHHKQQNSFASVAAQTYPHEDLELIFVDAHAKPSIAAAFAAFRLQHPALAASLLHCASTARSSGNNLAAAQANGELLIFLADDFEPCPDLVAAHAAYHALNPDINAVGIGPGLFPDDIRQDFFARWQEDSGHIFGVPMRSTMAVWPRQYFYAGNASIKKAKFDALGGFDEHFLSTPGTTMNSACAGSPAAVTRSSSLPRLRRIGTQCRSKNAARRWNSLVHRHGCWNDCTRIWITDGARCSGAARTFAAQYLQNMRRHIPGLLSMQNNWMRHSGVGIYPASPTPLCPPLITPDESYRLARSCAPQERRHPRDDAVGRTDAVADRYPTAILTGAKEQSRNPCQSHRDASATSSSTLLCAKQAHFCLNAGSPSALRRLRCSLLRIGMQHLARQVEFVLQPGAQRCKRGPVTQCWWIHQVIGVPV